MIARILALAASALVIGLLARPVASAASLELVATPRSPAFSGFEVVFEDGVGDGLLRLNEVTSFSGVTSLCTPNCSVFESKLLLVPDLTGFSSGSGGAWGFGNDSGGNSLQALGATSLWSYATVAAPVPEPSQSALLVLGLAGMAWRCAGRASFTSAQRARAAKVRDRDQQCPANGRA